MQPPSNDMPHSILTIPGGHICRRGLHPAAPKRVPKAAHKFGSHVVGGSSRGPRAGDLFDSRLPVKGLHSEPRRVCNLPSGLRILGSSPIAQPFKTARAGRKSLQLKPGKVGTWLSCNPKTQEGGKASIRYVLPGPSRYP